jgi:hypothetical protein
MGSEKKTLFIYLFCLSSLLAREPETVQWTGLGDGDGVKASSMRAMTGYVHLLGLCPWTLLRSRQRICATMGWLQRCAQGAALLLHGLSDDVGQSSP